MILSSCSSLTSGICAGEDGDKNELRGPRYSWREFNAGTCVHPHVGGGGSAKLGRICYQSFQVLSRIYCRISESESPQPMPPHFPPVPRTPYQ